MKIFRKVLMSVRLRIQYFAKEIVNMQIRKIALKHISMVDHNSTYQYL